MLADIDEGAPLNIRRHAALESPSNLSSSSRLANFNECANDGVVTPVKDHDGPLTILLVRHGESVGNVRPGIYEKIPDHAIPLTPEGREMSIKAGQICRQYIEESCNSSPVKMWISPFLRTRQTAECMLQDAGLSNLVVDIVETPLLVEQDWGVFEGCSNRDPQLQLDSYLSQVGVRARRMKQYGGSFYARWPMGESCFDVCVRTQQLFHRILDDWKDRSSHGRGNKKRAPIRTVIIVSHGITIRSFALMWCQYPPEYVDVAPNPPNCSIRLLSSASKNWDAGYIFGGFDRNGSEVHVESLAASSSNVIASFCVSHAQTFRSRGTAESAYGPRASDGYRALVRELSDINHEFYSGEMKPSCMPGSLFTSWHAKLYNYVMCLCSTYPGECFLCRTLSITSMLAAAGAMAFLTWKRLKVS